MTIRYPIDFYTIVYINSKRKETKEIHGKKGVITARAEGEDQWRYGVFIYDDEIGWDIGEDELIVTNEKEDPNKLS